MLNVYFKEWKTGRLKRLQYLGYYVLLMVIAIVLIMGAVMLGSAAQSAGEMNAESIMSSMGIPLAIGLGVFILIMAVAQANILAKRIRDMGLPALWTILGLIAVSIVLNILFPAQTMEVNTAIADINGTTAMAASAEASSSSIVVQVFDAIVFLSLILIPSDTFSKNKAQ